jgi:hypothetical protein
MHGVGWVCVSVFMFAESQSIVQLYTTSSILRTMELLLRRRFTAGRQPSADLSVFVRSIIVHDELDIKLRRGCSGQDRVGTKENPDGDDEVCIWRKRRHNAASVVSQFPSLTPNLLIPFTRRILASSSGLSKPASQPHKPADEPRQVARWDARLDSGERRLSSTAALL